MCCCLLSCAAALGPCLLGAMEQLETASSRPRKRAHVSIKRRDICRREAGSSHRETSTPPAQHQNYKHGRRTRTLQPSLHPPGSRRSGVKKRRDRAHSPYPVLASSKGGRDRAHSPYPVLASSKGAFRCKIFWILATVALSFVFGN